MNNFYKIVFEQPGAVKMFTADGRDKIYIFGETKIFLVAQNFVENKLLYTVLLIKIKLHFLERPTNKYSVS